MYYNKCICPKMGKCGIFQQKEKGFFNLHVLHEKQVKNHPECFFNNSREFDPYTVYNEKSFEIERILF